MTFQEFKREIFSFSEQMNLFSYERIAAFHKMLRSELNRRNMQTNVWLNPWKLGAVQQKN